ncbi:TauD/TfdA family dioxygenase [Nonomuraea sp. NPDC052116]|uniref:TauD/TfdA family dioxygenase n=1 Tax=Nonomuraea sp. NPDC052116 TaxID=3155665 RepID=UPI003413543F
MVASLPDERALPHVMEAGAEGEPLAELVAARRPELRRRLHRDGALLFRGFAVGAGGGDVGGFNEVVCALSGEPLAYSERSSPRSVIEDRVYTSTDYPPDQEIFLHNENSYQDSWPRTLYFFCRRPPETLGATPLADVRRVLAAVDPQVREELDRRGWSVVRNFHDGFGVDWRYVFGTEDRAEVERHCRNHGLTCEWSEGRLRTTAVRRAVHTHHETGESVWFNHITFFHHTTLPADVREGLLALVDEEDLPANTYYGDGGRIDDDVVAHLRECYRAASVRFDWCQDDVLVVDNMLAAHGREPFTGPRQIAVAMAEAHRPGVSAAVKGAAR